MLTFLYIYWIFLLQSEAIETRGKISEKLLNGELAEVRKKMKINKKQVIVGSFLLLMIAAVLWYAKLMFPIREGTSEEFWWITCGVNLNGRGEDTIGGMYQPREGWYIYYIQGYHGRFLYRVPRSEAVADYPEVLKRFEKSGRESKSDSKQHRRYLAIEQDRSQIENNPEKFLMLIREDLMNQYKSKSEKLYQYGLEAEKIFEERWIRAKVFWCNIVFEILFFGFLVLFAFWPWLYNRNLWRFSLHLGLLPLLLFLPHYLGYCSWTFTSAGPSEGALYPWVIVWFRNIPIWTPFDQWLLGALPKILESFSQPLGPMLSISGGRTLGPIAALLIGFVVFVLTQVIFIYLKSKKILSQTSIGNASESNDDKKSQQSSKDNPENRVP